MKAYVGLISQIQDLLSYMPANTNPTAAGWIVTEGGNKNRPRPILYPREMPNDRESLESCVTDSAEYGTSFTVIQTTRFVLMRQPLEHHRKRTTAVDTGGDSWWF
ncbi:hypothetical protein KIN20_012449 [Parelaphostrongylus tenuis]|uniref:Uncharacterized protein n=1 Tax=Parelaphostrongylus tenuis TaxID=148309 RepID=A0AAD5QLT5_PARTN|nr:hypothetical protein KIN20_012449 [Parelaphostrongylus tenuis]